LRAAFVLVGIALVCPAVGLTPGCGGTEMMCLPASLVSQEVLDDGVYIATLDREPNEVWTSAKTALKGESSRPISVQDDVRRAVVAIDDATITILVERYDRDRSTLRVSARKYGVNNGEIAKLVYDKILHEVETK